MSKIITQLEEGASLWAGLGRSDMLISAPSVACRVSRLWMNVAVDNPTGIAITPSIMKSVPFPDGAWIPTIRKQKINIKTNSREKLKQACPEEEAKGNGRQNTNLLGISFETLNVDTMWW